MRKTNNRPDCAVNPDISKGSTTFAFQPPACEGDACTAVRAAGLICDANQVGNDILVAVFGLGYSGIDPGSGPIATVHVDYASPQCSLNAPGWLVPGQTALADLNNQPIPHASSHGQLTCGCRGDIDQSGLTNLFDTLACIDFVIGRQSPGGTRGRCANSDNSAGDARAGSRGGFTTTCPEDLRPNLPPSALGLCASVFIRGWTVARGLAVISLHRRVAEPPGPRFPGGALPPPETRPQARNPPRISA